MLSEVLQHLIENDKTTAKQLAFVADVVPQTVYNWLAGKGAPTEVAIRRWITSHPSEAVRTATLREMTNNQASFAQPTSDPHLDINNDGTIDLADALASQIRVCKSSQDTLSIVHQSYVNDPGSVSLSELDMLISSIDAARQYQDATYLICTREISKRRRAKPLGVAS